MKLLAKDSEGEIIEFEEIPQEDLWEDGEISNNTCMIKIYNNVVADGKWKLIRRIK